MRVGEPDLSAVPQPSGHLRRSVLDVEWMEWSLMRIGRISVAGADGAEPRLVVAAPETNCAVDVRVALGLWLERRGAARTRSRLIAGAIAPGSLTGLLSGGEAALDAVREAVDEDLGDALVELTGARWLSPVDPPTVRDFTAFEEHAIEAGRRIGRPVAPEMYELPVFYKGNPTTLLGHDNEVPWPGFTDHMDYELELGLVIGRSARDLNPERAHSAIFGITAFNDFSARDLQRREMAVGLGPAKSKDFATSVGPWVVTLDEADLADVPMSAKVNGELWSSGNAGDAMWSAEELVAWASTGETVNPGDLLATGTVGAGCGFELGRRLAPGDVVELDIAGVGVLRNRLGNPAEPTWTPPRRTARHTRPAMVE